MHRLIVLIVLVVTFAVLLALSRSAAGWKHAVVAGEPGALLYAASFDGGGTDGFNAVWEQYAGRLASQLDAGRIQISVGEPGSGSYSVAAPHFGDFDLRVEARAVSGPVDNGYGVVFRLQNKDNHLVDDDNYYLFLISSDGYYRVSRSVDGGVKIISDWIESPLINQELDAVNRLRVVALGDQFQFFINDQPVSLCIPDDPDALSTINPLSGECMGGAMLDTLTDPAIPNGQVGVSALWTAGADDEPVVATFDNLLVYAPDASF
ncbi:MAG: hypothetical protein IT319_19595 [Anaerolineae bacterium]|nr:hypothetical protein [Anaerolineae bacterium]